MQVNNAHLARLGGFVSSLSLFAVYKSPAKVIQIRWAGGEAPC